MPEENTSPYNNQATILYIKDELEANGIEYKAIRMYDGEFNLDLDGIYAEGQEFLTEMEEKYPGKKDGILIKCAAGISRSPSMLINHLCVSRRMSYLEALNYLREKEYRQAIEFGTSPNQFFAQMLKGKYK